MRLTPPRTVHIVVYPGCKAIEVIGALTVFDHANQQRQALGHPPAYDLRLVAPQAGEVMADSLISFSATTLPDPACADTALVIGARDIHQALAQQPALIDWCRHVAARRQRLIGVCSGAFFLAEAGVLKGLEVTTHWRLADRLAQDYPALRVNADAIFIQQQHLWTCAGVSAVLDLSLALVEQDLGQALALAIARELVIYLKRPGGQAQFSQHLGSQMAQHAGIGALQGWILQHLEQPLGLEHLAARMNMSSRNLRRLFQREAQCSPSAFVERARLERAQRLLVQGTMPLKRVASH
ncbi:GlxA family transcriptional regulator [Pseudomonas cremoricolorata]|uniref:GlxA family transcriptional regulator n=1 Tax=Pseudomonas cremoricolorata TaxID=157783 RepID=UPI000A79223F|nr:DJ-1/PfpI family protein [Pseudomonas cremoricolorata]